MKIGILGAGQLGRMLALSGYPMGLTFSFFDPSKDSPSSQLSTQFCAPYDDRKALDAFSKSADIFTYEFENVPLSAARLIKSSKPIFPNPIALEKSQDRLVEKTFLKGLGIPTPAFLPCSKKEEILVAAKKIGFPCILKTRRGGYDGKGQFFLRSEKDIMSAKEIFGKELILEQCIDFSRELSIIAVRGKDGKEAFYPLSENVHHEGILRTSKPINDPSLQKKARSYASKVLKELDYIGVLAIEFFESKGKLIANEMAPRVHNSGHWTINGANTSQFENHLRAIAGLPLGKTEAIGYPAMVNLIGSFKNNIEVLKNPSFHLHLYGKEERPKRKIGHINITAKSVTEREKLISEALALARE